MSNRVFYPLLAFLMIAPYLVVGYYWNSIPDIIPIHYDINMQPDNWAPKTTGIPMIAGITVFVVAIMLLAAKFDPKQNIQKYMGVYRSIILATVTFLSGLLVMEVLRHVGYPIDFNYLPLAVVVLIGFVGNLMLKLKPSYFVGIRTPWTLENEEVWRRTHRMGGYLWVFASLVMIPVILLTPPATTSISMLCYVGVIAIVPVAYSAWLYYKLRGEAGKG